MTFERYRQDLEKLISVGKRLSIAMYLEMHPDQAERLKDQIDLKSIPKVSENYQNWYSEALICVKQILPDRLDDFMSYYKPLKPRKQLNYETYTISDYLEGLVLKNHFGEEIVGPKAGISKFSQQLKILESLNERFISSLFDIKGLVQADILDDELEAAEELNKKGFHRASGAVAGVVLEGHLRNICHLHNISISKNATLGKINDTLKDKGVIEIPNWRFIQHLIDIRNLCDHKKEKDPTKEMIQVLIDGVRKITKTVF